MIDTSMALMMEDSVIVGNGILRAKALVAPIAWIVAQFAFGLREIERPTNCDLLV